MEFTGKIDSITQDYGSGKVKVTFAVNESRKVLTEYEKIKDADKLKITAVKYRNRRSLDANAYMWVLLEKMAEVLHTTKDDLYIQMLDRYGVFTHIVVQPQVVARVKAEWRVVRELGEITVGSMTGIQLQCFFGSSTYDTKEMARLIDGIISECKALDIETMTPDELDQMKAAWGQKYEADHEKAV